MVGCYARASSTAKRFDTRRQGAILWAPNEQIVNRASSAAFIGVQLLRIWPSSIDRPTRRPRMRREGRYEMIARADERQSMVIDDLVENQPIDRLVRFVLAPGPFSSDLTSSVNGAAEPQRGGGRSREVSVTVSGAHGRQHVSLRSARGLGLCWRAVGPTYWGRADGTTSGSAPASHGWR